VQTAAGCERRRNRSASIRVARPVVGRRARRRASHARQFDVWRAPSSVHFASRGLAWIALGAARRCFADEVTSMTNAERLDAASAHDSSDRQSRRFHPAPDVNLASRAPARGLHRSQWHDGRSQLCAITTTIAGTGSRFSSTFAPGICTIEPRYSQSLMAAAYVAGWVRAKRIHRRAIRASKQFLRCIAHSRLTGFLIFYRALLPEESFWAGRMCKGDRRGCSASSVSLAMPALAATIGQAVLGAELAAAYPALATGIGNVAVSTALNGGDVQRAVVGAVSWRRRWRGRRRRSIRNRLHYHRRRRCERNKRRNRRWRHAIRRDGRFA
jgi:hypothetical protein